MNNEMIIYLVLALRFTFVTNRRERMGEKKSLKKYYVFSVKISNTCNKILYKVISLGDTN